MNYNIDKKKILDTLMEYKGFSKKTEFALFLDVKPNVLSNWYNRNSFDENILTNKFPEISYTWLLTGEGSMLKNNTNTIVGDNNINASNINSKNSNVKVGANNDVNSCIEEKKELLERLKQSQEQLSESQKQVSKLIEIISNKLK